MLAPVFLLFLAINVAMYLPGALLIREAMIRWKKGWATVFALGAAYAIMEEGIADATLFNPNSPVVGALGSYGHFAGVNWVWLPGILLIHIVFSISLPLVLLGLALPETRGRSLLTDRQVLWTFLILAVDTAALTTIGWLALHWWDGIPITAACLVAIAGFALLGRRLPEHLFAPPRSAPSATPLRFYLLGFTLFPVSVLIEGLAEAAGLPPALAIAGLLAFLLTVGLAFRAGIGRAAHGRQMIAFAAGALTPLTALGLVAGLRLPVELLVDAGMVWFFLHLWRRYRPSVPSAPAPLAVAA